MSNSIFLEEGRWKAWSESALTLNNENNILPLWRTGAFQDKNV